MDTAKTEHEQRYYLMKEAAIERWLVLDSVRRKILSDCYANINTPFESDVIKSNEWATNMAMHMLGWI